MVQLISLISVVALALSASASPTRRAMSVHESREAVPHGFATAEKPSAKTMLNLRIALAAKDLSTLEETLLTISTPGSPSYGQWLSAEEVQVYTTPSEETVASVKAYLAEHGVTDVRVSGGSNDWLDFSASVETANALFDAQFHNYVDIESGERIIRTLEYSIPKDLAGAIDLVHPTTSFAKVRYGPKSPMMSIPLPSNVTARANTAPASCANTITPACLRAMYAIPTTAATQSTNKLAVSGFIEQYANSADLKRFLTSLRTDISSSTSFTLQTLDGGSNPQTLSLAGIEADLDIEYTVGMATGVPVVFISVGESNTDGVDGFIDIINFMLAETAPPQVLTTSYGFDETDLTLALATKVCNSYMSLTARGVSILFASGDGGVSGGQSQSCTTFIPAFPGGCPYQTAVGATTGTSPETSADFSSGGFSNYFARPTWQTDAVATYLTALGTTNSGKFNSTGRGFPDVAAMGDNVEINYQNQFGLVAGTSCSSPIFASIVSLINDRLIAAGKPVLGFLNPFIYANPQAFFDITTGDNPGCGTNGFPAKAGWDPVTGMGTPNFPALLTAAGL